MPQLRIKNGLQKGHLISLAGANALVIGRDPSCGLQLDDKGVSREHAEFYCVGEMVFIRDLGSRNGTFVNEERVQEELLREGDTVRVGATALAFENKSAEEPVRNAPSDDDPDLKGSLDLKLEDLYVLDSPLAEREGGLFTALCQMTQLLQNEKNEKVLYERMLALIQGCIPADYLYLFLRDEKTGTVLARARIAKETDNIPISRSILKRVISQSRAILTPDAMRDERFKGGDSIVSNRIRSVLCVPVQGAGKQALGAIYAVNSRLAETFEQGDLQLLTALGSHLALALENLQALRDRQGMFFRTVGRLVSLLEGQPARQWGHAERVSLYCLAMGAEMKLPENQIFFTGLAGLLHDIGKVPSVSGVSAVASQRSTGVAPVLAALDFLRDIHSLQEALAIIRSHCECFDGSGQPEGLKGAQISLGARILGLANVFDKLVFPVGTQSPDVDPEAALVRKAFAEIQQDGGKRFDPAVVQALTAAYRNGALSSVAGPVSG
jgi:HD-GYP domain-containing protein (c-di-GMP phosphodiesterase class II)